MTDTIFPTAPAMGTQVPATNASQIARDFLAGRRSNGKACFAAPGPSGEDLDTILKTAMRVPDHRRLGPWRFIVFEGTARANFSETLAELKSKEVPQPPDSAVEDARGLLMRAPTVVCVVSSPDVAHKTPVWEQELSVGAVCYNLLLAANASGWAGCWLSEWISFHDGVNSALGLTEDERIAGFIYLGTATHDPQERLRPDPELRITHWK